MALINVGSLIVRRQAAAVAIYADEIKEIDVARLPPRVNRRAAAKIVSHLFFPVSPRSIEAWPLAVRRINNHALIETKELLAVAQAKLDAAPVIRTGQRKAA